MIRLDIFSDPVCPWCLIGKAHLDRALEAHADHPFVIAWHPFQLNPDMPAEGVEKRPYLAKRLGGEAKVDAIHDRLRQIAKEAGVAMDPDKPEMLPNTMNAHRLIHWAGIEGKQAAMVSALFRAYWRDGRDIGDSEELCDIAEEIGMDPKAVARLLATDADIDDLRARDVDARKKGVTAVPTFLIAQQYVVSGAQPPEVWAQVIEELVAKAAEESK
ncbi:DsbA family oxidoreductase [Cypionkella sp.]|uniref:DsbA family oxidoreductase n=1 Tax=Cypionkella sp. TaxID=2811411 RepID=UPI00272836E2|nr:DsbA family oxidoreductase [Cypionkella sp.]MDO8985504.1 DsbA family oxidoreductase [Cypionkella sp.]MDP2048831.1 DsbA family oxidoreductase [Cypionkella sp.]